MSAVVTVFISDLETKRMSEKAQISLPLHTPPLLRAFEQEVPLKITFLFIKLTFMFAVLPDIEQAYLITILFFFILRSFSRGIIFFIYREEQSSPYLPYQNTSLRERHRIWYFVPEITTS